MNKDSAAEALRGLTTLADTFRLDVEYAHLARDSVRAPKFPNPYREVDTGIAPLELCAQLVFWYPGSAYSDGSQPVFVVVVGDLVMVLIVDRRQQVDHMLIYSGTHNGFGCDPRQLPEPGYPDVGILDHIGKTYSRGTLYPALFSVAPVAYFTRAMQGASPWSQKDVSKLIGGWHVWKEIHEDKGHPRSSTVDGVYPGAGMPPLPLMGGSISDREDK